MRAAPLVCCRDAVARETIRPSFWTLDIDQLAGALSLVAAGPGIGERLTPLCLLGLAEADLDPPLQISYVARRHRIAI